MTYEQKRRCILLQAFAASDEEYGKLLQDTVDVEDLRLSLQQELTEEQFAYVEKIIAAYGKLAYCTAEVACKYMIFPSERV